MNSRINTALRHLPLFAMALGACGGADKAAPPTAAPTEAAPTEAAEAQTAPLEKAPAGPVAVPEPNVAEAAKVAAKAFDAKSAFNTTCASCHGETGKGDGPAAVALTPKPAAFGAAEFWATRDRAAIKKAIKEGGPAVGKSPLMAPFGAMFDEIQLEALVDHVMTFKPAS